MKNSRLERLREELVKNNIDGALIYSDANRNYLSNFTGDESYILVTNKEAIFITDSRYTEQARSETIGFEVRQYSLSVTEYIKDILKSLNIKSLGFEDNYMTVKMFEELNQIGDKIQFVKIGNMVEKLRQIKDDIEIANIEKAASIADEAFSHMLQFIKPGMTEIEVGLELEFFMRQKGASGLAFPSIVASGKRSSLPHGRATEKKIEKGDFLTLDYGCVYNGYCSDMTRTVVIGKASDKQKEIYYTVLEANKKALDFIRPGITGVELDKIAREVIENNGYGVYFGHGLGHGVGMEIHELPYISKKGKEPLEPGMTITDEPGIYIPDFGGVRIEDLVVVTQDGYRVLSKSDKELIEID